MTNFQALELILKAARCLRRALAQIASVDPDLARQFRRAMASAALNLSEGRRRSGRDRRHHYRVGAGSADEVVTCLRVAAALGYISLSSVEEPLEYLDHALAMLWNLTH